MNNACPLVSVVIPTYNRATLLYRSVNSILIQTIKDFELIIVDDGSTDNTGRVVKSFNDKRIRYICYNENKGACAARNIGIKNSRGKFIAFQDSDDEWLPEKLQKQLDCFNKTPEIGVAYCTFWKIKGDKQIIAPSNKENINGNIFYQILKEQFITTQSILVKRECFSKAGYFDESLPRLQDWELLIRLSKYYDFAFVDEPLLRTYYSVDSISADDMSYFIAIKLIYKKQLITNISDKQLLAKYQYQIGKISARYEDADESKKFLRLSALNRPFNIKYIVFAVLSFMPKYTKLINLLKLKSNQSPW
jgi:glycosyltransferase involved in cell wall biosynthesis